MDYKLNALDELIEAVEAGDDLPEIGHGYWQFLPAGACILAARTYHDGSLDAALALHEALLPGWIARVTTGAAAAGVNYSHCTVEDWNEATEVDANNQPTPARAWLLAVLKAYRSMQA